MSSRTQYQRRANGAAKRERAARNVGNIRLKLQPFIGQVDRSAKVVELSVMEAVAHLAHTAGRGLYLTDYDVAVWSTTPTSPYYSREMGESGVALVEDGATEHEYAIEFFDSLLSK